MDRLKLREIAVRHAALSGMVYAQAPDFEPHEWVLRALAEAAETQKEEREAAWEGGREVGYDAGYGHGYDAGFEDADNRSDGT